MLIQFFPHLLCETLRVSLCETLREPLVGYGLHAMIFKRRFHAKLTKHAQRKSKENAVSSLEHSMLIQIFPQIPQINAEKYHRK